MKLTEQLSENVEPVLRDYIHAAICEALEPVEARLRLEKQAYEALLVKQREEIAGLRQQLYQSLQTP